MEPMIDFSDKTSSEKNCPENTYSEQACSEQAYSADVAETILKVQDERVLSAFSAEHSTWRSVSPIFLSEPESSEQKCLLSEPDSSLPEQKNSFSGQESSQNQQELASSAVLPAGATPEEISSDILIFALPETSDLTNSPGLSTPSNQSNVFDSSVFSGHSTVSGTLVSLDKLHSSEYVGLLKDAEPEDQVPAMEKMALRIESELKRNATLSVSALVRKIGAPRDYIMEGLGWLGCQGKIQIIDTHRVRSVSLTKQKQSDL